MQRDFFLMGDRGGKFTKAKHDHRENEEFEAFTNEVSLFRKLHFKHSVLFFFRSCEFDDAVRFLSINVTLG